MSKYGVFSGPYFPLIGLNTKIYGINLRIQSEYGNIQTRKNSVFGHFSRSAIFYQGFEFRGNSQIDVFTKDVKLTSWGLVGF